MKRDRSARVYAHVPRQMADGRWVCKGGPRPEGCGFHADEYAQAVNHATQNGATPPDMPRDQWLTA